MDEQVKFTKNGRRKWSREQRAGIVKEYESGVHINELCRKYNIHANMIYRWKRQLESNANGEVVSKSMYMAAMKKIEELERALGRKTLEADILKKNCELKGIKLAEGM